MPRTVSSVAPSTRARAARAAGVRRGAWRRRSGVVVAGAGPGGLEAARVAAESGHDVVLYERADVAGGQLRIAAAGPTRAELLDFVIYAERELARLGVDVRLGTPATRDAVLADEPDLVVAATGATPLPPEFPFDADAHVVTVWDLLGGAVTEIPARAAVLDDGSGFWHGVSAAEYLAERGAAVELLTPARGIALAIPHESVAGLLGRLGTERRALPHADHGDVGAWIDRVARGCRHGRAVRAGGGAARGQDEAASRRCAAARARRRGPGARVDRRLLVGTASEPRRARRERRAAPVRRRPDRERRHGRQV